LNKHVTGHLLRRFLGAMPVTDGAATALKLVSGARDSHQQRILIAFLTTLAPGISGDLAERLQVRSNNLVKCWAVVEVYSVIDVWLRV